MQLLTKEEKARLDDELKALFAKRPVIALAIGEAREKGDLKENADYHAARDELAMLEARIKNLEERLKSASVIDPNEVPEGIVFLGSTVKVTDVATGEEETFRIVGELGNNAFDLDSDVMEVSASSPLGESLLRAHVGDTVRVPLPRGDRRYRVDQLL
jgi:transcription elongation factor GreA